MFRHACKNLLPVTSLLSLGLMSMLLGVIPAFGSDFDFEFNTDGILPSSQGAVYANVSIVPETAAFSVGGGLLHQNILGTGYYEVLSAFDHRFDATIEWSAKVVQSGPFTADVSLFDTDPLNLREWDFNLRSTGVEVNFPGVVVPLDTTNAFHIYKVTIPGGSDAFSLSVDGSFRFSGAARVTPGFPYPFKGVVAWGAQTNSNAQLDWDYIRFTNHVTTTPEPGALSLLAGAVVAGSGFALRRRRRQHQRAW